MTEQHTAGQGGATALPNADGLKRFVLPKEWGWIDIEDPREGWESFWEVLRRNMARNQEAARKLRADAKDALEIAEVHEARAAEVYQVLSAMERTPIAWPAQGTSASGQDPQGLEAKPAGPVAESDAPNP